MSWFDTTKIASMATKAMKEAQKTLDTALDIKEEEEAGLAPGSQDSLWQGWKMSKSESDSKLTEKAAPAAAMPASASLWGSFSGSFIEAGSVGGADTDTGVVTTAPRAQAAPAPAREVGPGHSSVLGGEEEGDIEVQLGPLTVDTGDKFAKSRLVVTEKEVPSPDSSPSVETISQEAEEQEEAPGPAMLQSVELASPQSASSIEIISPESEAAPELSSPSSGSAVEVISPEPEPVAALDSLDSSVSSDKTVMETADTAAGLQLQLEAAMAESEKKSESSRSVSSLVRVEGAARSDTTSSDIEVLQLRKSSCGSGHTRTSSDQSSVSAGGDTAAAAAAGAQDRDQLARRNRELAELVAARESKLVAVSREIVQLQEESGDMAVRLQEALEQLQLERARGGELEARTRVDQDQVASLKKELAKLQQQLKARGGDDQEKEEIISDLRSEGEALAKQNGKLSETIRKLRATAKTHDSEVTKLKTDLDKNVTEVERLRKSLNAKNEIEGSQSETIKSLTDANKAWETDSKKLKSDLEDNVEKVLGLRSSLEGAYREMAEMKRKLEDAAGEAAAAALSKEVALRQETVARLEEERRGWNSQKQRLELQLVNLQDSLQMAEAGSREREEKLRHEVVAMRVRLEESDRRQEDMSDCVGQATKPLLRQIETLQSSLREVTTVQERVEHSLGERLHLAQQSLAHAQERERALAEKVAELGVKEAACQEQASQERGRRVAAEAGLEEARERLRAAEDRRARERQEAESERASVGEEVGELRRDKEFLAASLSTERSESEGRQRKCVALMEQLRERDRRVKELQQELEARHQAGTRTPTPGRSSVTSAVSASPSPSLHSQEAWMPGDEVFYSSAAPASSLYDTARFGSSTALLESLGAQLKLKEGEVLAAQAALAEQGREREAVTREVTRLTILAEQNESLKEEIAHLKEELSKIQQKYDTMLTMYGEKVEEAEELKLDLQDVKEVYKMQIDQLTHSTTTASDQT